MAAYKKAPQAGGAGTNLVDRNHITAERLAKALDGRRSGEGWQARCPAHDDRKPSLSISEGKDGRILVHCFVCSQDAVIEVLQARGLWPVGRGSTTARYPKSSPSSAPWEESEPPPPHLSHRTLGKPDRLFEVKDGGDRLFGVHARWDNPAGDGKEMRWWRCGRWTLDGIPKAEAPLYGAHELRGWDDTAPLVLTEGQPAAEALWSCGMPAVATVTGAATVPSKRVLSDLAGRKVVLWPDNDDQGRRHMQRVGESLVGIAASIEVIDSQSLDLPDGGDAREWVDWWDAKDTEAIFEELHRLHRMPIECKGKPFASSASYEPVVVRMSDVEAEEISWLWYPRIARSKLTVLEGDPGVGKSFVTAAVATAVSLGKGLPGCDETEPGTVLMLTAEDGLGDTLRPRLDLLSADVGRILAGATAAQRLPVGRQEPAKAASSRQKALSGPQSREAGAAVAQHYGQKLGV